MSIRYVIFHTCFESRNFINNTNVMFYSFNIRFVLKGINSFLHKETGKKFATLTLSKQFGFTFLKTLTAEDTDYLFLISDLIKNKKRSPHYFFLFAYSLLCKVNRL